LLLHELPRQEAQLLLQRLGQISDKLLIELVPKTPNPLPEQAPILQGVEAIREQMVSLGCSAPDFLLSTLQPAKGGELRLANLREKAFEGTLEITAPAGFVVEPKSVQVKLAGGDRTTPAGVDRFCQGPPRP